MVTWKAISVFLFQRKMNTHGFWYSCIPTELFENRKDIPVGFTKNEIEKMRIDGKHYWYDNSVLLELRFANKCAVPIKTAFYQTKANISIFRTFDKCLSLSSMKIFCYWLTSISLSQKKNVTLARSLAYLSVRL